MNNDPIPVAARAMCAVPELLFAAEATEQCITDFLGLYTQGASYFALDEAVKSLRDDALRLTQIALTKADGEPRKRKAYRFP